jgi:hypothetical protein
MRDYAPVYAGKCFTARKFRWRNTAAPNRDIGIRLAANRAAPRNHFWRCPRCARNSRRSELVIMYA